MLIIVVQPAAVAVVFQAAQPHSNGRRMQKRLCTAVCTPIKMPWMVKIKPERFTSLISTLLLLEIKPPQPLLQYFLTNLRFKISTAFCNVMLYFYIASYPSNFLKAPALFPD